jgi:hypothetical protein
MTKVPSMGLSAESLHRSGHISDKQMSKLKELRGTKLQKGRMTTFEHKGKDEGDKNGRGIPSVSVDEIDERSVQRTGSRFLPSKGGRAEGGTEFRSDQIDQKGFQRGKFPKGGDVSSRNPKTGNTRMKGAIPRQGGTYGGGGRDTQ